MKKKLSWLVVLSCICIYGAVNIKAHSALESKRPLVLKIGDIYGGGFVAYILQPADAGYDAKTQHGLIAARTDVVSGTTTGFAWSGGANVVTGATGNKLYDGSTNTDAVISKYKTSTALYAAKLCKDYGPVTEGWYMPCGHELYLLYTNLKTADDANNSKYGFTEFMYWTSYELTVDQVQGCNFHTGTFSGIAKIGARRLRAVRKF